MPYYIEDLKCPTCGGKMIMYYSPYCPTCIPKDKVKENLIQAKDYIEHKYGIKTRDYAAKDGKSSTKSNGEREEAWKEKFAPIPVEYITNPLPSYRFNELGMKWYQTPEGRAFLEKRDRAYKEAPDGEVLEIPYQDWWHHFCDCYEFSNDCWKVINWQYVYDMCKEDWQREITQLFIDEFGKCDIKIEISW